MVRPLIALMAIMVSLLLFSRCKKDTTQVQLVHFVNSQTTDRLNKILFTDAQNGFVVGGDRFYSCSILSTTNGGKSFTHLSYTPSGKSNYGICQKPNGTVVLVGFDSKFITSSDTGKTWQLTQLHSWRPLKDVGFFNNDEGIIIDGISFNSGVIYRIDAHGQTLQRDSFDYEMNDLEIISEKEALIAATGVVLHTTDKGRSWQMRSVKNENFTSLCRVKDKLWVCGSAGSIYRSDDRGQSWQRQRNGNVVTQKKLHLQDILMLDEQNGFAVGEEGAVLRTYDGGAHWASLKNFTSNHLRQIEKTPNGEVLICSDHGGIYRLVP